MAIKQLTLRNLLSFGPDAPPIDLLPLNVLIGPNGSGKSNILAALSLLQAAPGKLAAPTRGVGGGVSEWVWKGAAERTAMLEVVLDYRLNLLPLRHHIAFGDVNARFELRDEFIEEAQKRDPRKDQPYFYYKYNGGSPLINAEKPKGEQSEPEDDQDAFADNGDKKYGLKRLPPVQVRTDESILSQRKDPELYPALAHLAAFYESIKIYNDWGFGRACPLRATQAADLPGEQLAEDYSNFALFLNHLDNDTQAGPALRQSLKDVYQGVEDFGLRLESGAAQITLREKYVDRQVTFPAMRLSDGTLRYMCLVALLVDPQPPELLCIEEPELGLHPDLIPKIADLLVEASKRTQVIVTTHSDSWVDALSEHPEYVVVVEKHNGSTVTRRLENNEPLQSWLEKYRLGEVWASGEIGGNRY